MGETQKEVVITGESNTLIKQDWRRWGRNIVLFSIPLAVLYLGQISGVLNQTDKAFQLKDLLPTQMTWGGIVLYILNALQDLYLKWSRETKYTK